MFGTLTAVDRVTVDIGRGEFFVIVGPSGCGKTTLLRILAGLETATAGTIEVDTPAGSDRPVNSMVFQGESIFPWMTVWANAAYGLRMRDAPAAVIKERVGHYLDATGLTRFADYYPHQLSGGMKQRVSIARAFANDPEILLMDEPFSALDAQNKLLLQEELLAHLGGAEKDRGVHHPQRRRGGLSRRPHHGDDGAARSRQSDGAGAARPSRATSLNCKKRRSSANWCPASGPACAKKCSAPAIRKILKADDKD